VESGNLVEKFIAFLHWPLSSMTLHAPQFYICTCAFWQSRRQWLLNLLIDVWKDMTNTENMEKGSYMSGIYDLPLTSLYAEHTKYLLENMWSPLSDPLIIYFYLKKKTFNVTLISKKFCLKKQSPDLKHWIDRSHLSQSYIRRANQINSKILILASLKNFDGAWSSLSKIWLESNCLIKTIVGHQKESEILF
jgi:hypothetical protein